jgi:hypothetical protein
MSLHYQVNSELKLSHGKPSLINITINSTKSACTILPVHSEFSLIKTYRILHTLKEANLYIEYLKKIYKENTLPPVVLNSGQKDLF